MSTGTNPFHELQAPLAKFLNEHNVDTRLSIPDYILAQIVTNYLSTLELSHASFRSELMSYQHKVKILSDLAKRQAESLPPSEDTERILKFVERSASNAK